LIRLVNEMERKRPRVAFGLHGDRGQEALDLARKYEWPLSSNPAAKASASLPITPVSGVQPQNSERGHMEKLEEWKGRNAEHLALRFVG
jgi:hypothetical protein